MNKNQPVQLRQKIDYLRDKIQYLNEEVKYRGSFELKMKFIEFIDTTIQRVYQIQEKKQYSSQALKSKYQEQYKSEENQIEKRRFQKQKEQMNKKLKELDQRQKQMEVESLKIEIENAKLLKMGILKEATVKENELKVYINELQKKIKAQERQIQKICKMNKLQAKEIQNIKQERNRAEKNELQWKEKYQIDVGVLQTFNEKKVKYLYRHEQGLKITRSVVNITTEKKGCQRYFFCDLPLKFHIIKIIYGIKIGMVNAMQQIEYFDQISLYEKEDMQITYQDGQLNLLYIKRRVDLKLKYRPPKSQIVIMLFGKGDSVGLDQSK